MNGTSPAVINDKMDSRHPGSTIAAKLSSRLTRLRVGLARPVDGSALGAFRLLFGALMVWKVIRYFQHDFIGRYYIQPTFYFTYELFPFVAPLPGHWMYLLFLAMGVFALGITLGVFRSISWRRLAQATSG
jgi:hypothetical protein